MWSQFQPRLESPPCPCGCPRDDQIVLVGYDRLHGLPGEYTVVRCRTCGLMRTSPRPIAEDIAQYYPEDYGPYHATLVSADTPSPALSVPSHKSLFRRLCRSVFRFNVDRLPDMPPGRMLELGCASGRFLRHMARLGWEVAGIEPDSRAASAAQELGYPVFNGRLENAPDPPGPFDLIVGWMVLEHLHEPGASLRRLSQWLRPCGWFVFSVPNAASLEARIFGNAWYALQVPTHLFHYTPQTLRTLLRNTGWRVERIFHQRVIGNLVASIGYKLEDLGSSGRLTRFLIRFPEAGYRYQQVAYPAAFILSLFGQTGRMTVWARRADD